MNKKMMKRFYLALFVLVGAKAGIGYYYFAGCSDGSCINTSSPLISMSYMGLVGGLLSGIFFGKGYDDKCNT